MVDLMEYGFSKAVETDRWSCYEGHGFSVTVYGYMSMAFDGSEVARNTFVARSKDFTSAARPVSELGEWLMEKGITKSA